MRQYFPPSFPPRGRNFPPSFSTRGRTFVLALLLLPAVASAAGSLGRGIPEDYFFYLRRQESPERAFLAPLLDRAAAALREAKVGDALVDALAAGLSESRGDALRQESAHWRKVLSAVDWRSLLSREYAIGARFSIDWQSVRFLQASSSFDWLALFRVEPSARDRHLASLRDLALALGTLEVEVDPETGRTARLEVTETEREGVPTTILSVQGGEPRLCISAVGDVIGVASSAIELRRALRLLQGQGSGISVTEGEDYRRAMTGLPAPESGEMLLRPQILFGQLGSVARTVEKARLPDELGEIVAQVVRVLSAIVDAFDIVKSVAATETTEGRRLRAAYRIELTEEAAHRALYPALIGRPPVENFARLVPRTASGFMVTSGVDLERLYDATLQFVEKVFPDGAALIEAFRRRQERTGFDLKRDLLAPMEGRAVFLVFPLRRAPAVRAAPEAGKPAPPPGSDTGDTPPAPEAGKGEVGGWVAFVRLKDPARLEAKLDELVGKQGEGLRALGMGPEPVQLPEVPGKLHRLGLPFPAGVRLTFGISGDEFVIATSEERLREAILVRSGKVEDIRANPAYRDLAPPSGLPVHTASYRDLGDLSMRLENGLSSVSFFSVLAPASTDGSPNLPHELVTLAPKLVPLARVLGFLDQGAAYLVPEGGGYRGELVITVREGQPAPRPDPAAKPDKAAPGEKGAPAEKGGTSEKGTSDKSTSEKSASEKGAESSPPEKRIEKGADKSPRETPQKRRKIF